MQLRNKDNTADVFCTYTVDPDTGLPQSSHSPTDVTLGNVPGVSAFSFSGIKAGISTVSQEVVEPVPTVLAPAVGIAMSIKSDNAADVGIVIRLNVLGPGGVLMDPITVTLNGTAPVPLGILSRINSMYRLGGDIVGNVTVFNGANVYGFMEPGAQIMRTATYTIPAGHRAAIMNIIAAMTKAGGNDSGVIFALKYKPMESNVFGPIIAMAAYRAGNSQIQIGQEYSNGTAGPFDLQIVATASTADTDGQVYASGLLVNASVHP